jgi:hypothetical protein
MQLEALRTAEAAAVAAQRQAQELAVRVLQAA